MSSPNPTIYIKNLNDQIKKEELRAQLYALFSPYGKILDVVAQKGPKKKGQAFVVFRDLVGATSAMRGLDGELFYDKKMHIEYAKSASYATRRIQDPNFIPPSFNLHGNAQAGSTQLNGASSSKVTVSHAENDQRKRGREDGDGQDGRQNKRGKEEEDDDMDMEEDEDAPPPTAPPPVQGHLQSARPPSALLYCENLPAEVTDDVLAVLFQQYSGFQTTSLSAANPATKSKTAHVRYDTAEQASVAKDALDGFMIKKGWAMRVAYV